MMNTWFRGLASPVSDLLASPLPYAVLDSPALAIAHLRKFREASRLERVIRQQQAHRVVGIAKTVDGVDARGELKGEVGRVASPAMRPNASSPNNRWRLR